MDFLRWFRKEPHEVSLSHIELKEWIENVADEILTETYAQIHDIRKQVESAKEILERKNKGIRNASLHHLSEQDALAVQASRHAYTRALKKFIDEFEIGEIDYSSLEQKSKKLESDIQEFMENTSKHYYALRDHFKEMEGISRQLRHMQDQAIRLHALGRQENVHTYKSLLARIRKLNEVAIQAEELHNEIEDMKTHILELQTKKREISGKMDELEKSPEFRNLSKLKKDLQATKNNIQRLHNSFKKKLSGIDVDEVYRQRPLEALASDKNLEIIDILMKSEKKIDPKYIEKTLQKYHSLKDKKKEINSLLEKVSIMMDYKELEYQLEHTEEKLDKLSKELENKERQAVQLHIEEKKSFLSQDISAFAGYSVQIT